MLKVKSIQTPLALFLKPLAHLILAIALFFILEALDNNNANNSSYCRTCTSTNPKSFLTGRWNFSLNTVSVMANFDFNRLLIRSIDFLCRHNVCGWDGFNLSRIAVPSLHLKYILLNCR